MKVPQNVVNQVYGSVETDWHQHENGAGWVYKLAARIANKYISFESVKRSDVIREVVRTQKLNLDDSIIMADCIVKGLYAAGKTVVLP